MWLAIVAGAWYASPELDLRYGTPDPARYDRTRIGEPSHAELVRSRTAPGTPIDLIATRVPDDDPPPVPAHQFDQRVRG